MSKLAGMVGAPTLCASGTGLVLGLKVVPEPLSQKAQDASVVSACTVSLCVTPARAKAALSAG